MACKNMFKDDLSLPHTSGVGVAPDTLFALGHQSALYLSQLSVSLSARLATTQPSHRDTLRKEFPLRIHQSSQQKPVDTPEKEPPVAVPPSASSPARLVRQPAPPPGAITSLRWAHSFEKSSSTGSLQDKSYRQQLRHIRLVILQNCKLKTIHSI